MRRKQAVVIGAGGIGRGLVGQVLHDEGYDVVFADVDRELTDALNGKGGYTLRLVDQNTDKTYAIDRVRAVDAADGTAVAREIAQCDVAAVAVRWRNLPSVAPSIAAGILARSWLVGKPPLNILLCEDIVGAPKILRELLLPCFAPGDAHLLQDVGLVKTAIDRVVPHPTAEMRKNDAAHIVAEPSGALYVDQGAFVGGTPPLANTPTFAPFSFCEEKTRFIHGIGYAVCAYLGYLRGYEAVWQAAEDADILRVTKSAMRASAQAVAAHNCADVAALENFANEVAVRLANRPLGERIARVAADPLRQLQMGERLVGAVKLCRRYGADCDAILRGIAAALGYRGEGDPSADEVAWRLRVQGAEPFLLSVCGLDAYERAGVLAYYREPELLFIE
jgi:mannitol-1-phosphate 5-dehydrogenase